MARFDALGMFWEDLAPVKPPKKEKPKATPPEPIWLLPTYLPGIEEARAMRIPLLSDQELMAASRARERFTFDEECYPNYWLMGFKSRISKKVVYFELNEPNARLSPVDCAKLKWCMENLTTIGFNSKGYDLAKAALACAGKTVAELYRATQMIIEGVDGKPPMKQHMVLKSFGVKKLDADSIDLMPLPKGKLSLKMYAGRLHAKRMQDLPIPPGTVMTDDQKLITKWYWVNDLDNTELLHSALLEQIALREKIGARYDIDVRSRSDAQIAEDLLGAQIKKRTGVGYLARTMVEPGTTYKYNVPKFIKYESALMQWVLGQVQLSNFVISPGGKVLMPKELAKLKIEINKGIYKMGIGGLHSTEKNSAAIADDLYFVKDRDVTSYYPRIILNLNLKPSNLGEPFTMEYTTVVNDRVAAKARGDTITADTYKIVANGSFGKFGDKWSILYSPQLLIQTTITGQLSLLMLIERLELAGFEVMSANTDGLVTRGLRSRVNEFDAILSKWEKDTGFTTEEVEYQAVYSRDVNNYLAVYMTPQKGKMYKGKGIFGDVPLDKNPVTRICYLAAIEHIINKTDYVKMITDCDDLTKFTTMQRVTGGAYKSGVYLGKVIRWYYATGEDGVIINAKNGNQIPRSEGAKPCMTLPDTLPTDINHEWYIAETTKLLRQIGFTKGEIPVDEEDDDEESEETNDEITIED